MGGLEVFVGGVECCEGEFVGTARVFDQRRGWL